MINVVHYDNWKKEVLSNSIPNIHESLIADTYIIISTYKHNQHWSLASLKLKIAPPNSNVLINF